MVSVCNFQSFPDAGAVIERRCDEEVVRIGELPEEDRLATIVDSRAVHSRLFKGLAPSEFPDAAGTWRGTPGSSLEAAPRAVFIARRMPGLRYRDLCLPAERVPEAMAKLEVEVRHLWSERPGKEDPWRDASFVELARLTAHFFNIHPFMDGNGHLWRLILPVLARRLELEVRKHWTVHKRPYGPEFSLALQWHKDHPSLLADYLRRWFRPVQAATAD